ncbi:hypothetical protein IMG5_125630, partial [Ichthyophthirius multifiliis]
DSFHVIYAKMDIFIMIFNVFQPVQIINIKMFRLELAMIVIINVKLVLMQPIVILAFRIKLHLLVD